MIFILVIQEERFKNDSQCQEESKKDSLGDILKEHSRKYSLGDM